MRWKQLTLLLLLTNLLTIAGSILLFNRTWLYYNQLNATRLDPLGLDVYPTSPEATEAPSAEESPPTVLFFGDSRAVSWPFLTDQPQIQFINRGIGAQTSAQVKLRFAAHVEPLQPEVVVIQVGINDLKTIPLFPHKQQEIIDHCQENIKQMVQQAVDGGATVILTTIFPVGQPPLARRPVWSSAVAEAVVTVNDFLTTLASEQVIIFDSYQLLVGDNDPLINPTYAADLLHLNQAGYDRLNDHLEPLLINLLTRP